MNKNEADAEKFFFCLNELKNCSFNQLIEQLNRLYCSIGKSDADEGLAAYQTLETACQVFEVDNELTKKEKLVCNSLRRAIRQHMMALQTKSPDDKLIERKCTFVYRSFRDEH